MFIVYTISLQCTIIDLRVIRGYDRELREGKQLLYTAALGVGAVYLFEEAVSLEMNSCTLLISFRYFLHSLFVPLMFVHVLAGGHVVQTFGVFIKNV